jgi:3-phosphoshikimate 1-carboxyvinyltransferase
MIIRPAKYLRGEVTLPGDKSISHRAAMIAAIAEGETRIDNFATSADCASTLECLRLLGVNIRREGATVWIQGVGRQGFKVPSEPLDCGNSGTTMRLMAGILAGQQFESVMTGDESLQKRPMKRIIDPLTEMGTAIESDGGRAPLTIRGISPLRPIDYRPPVASAQIKSCVLLAGLNAAGRTSVIEPVETRDHTERMLRWFGVDVTEISDRSARTIAVKTGDELRAPTGMMVPSDISAAAFFMVGASCLEGSDIRMRNVGVNPTRSAIVNVLTEIAGATIQVEERAEVNNEPVATILVKGKLSRQTSNEIRGAVVANLIDELPILAVLATRLELGLEVRDASELRVKETDRIAAVAENLRRMGATVEEFDDGFRVEKSVLKGARVDSFGDHRIAMAFAIAGLMAEGETEIDGSECAAVSFPEFFEQLENVAFYE